MIPSFTAIPIGIFFKLSFSHNVSATASLTIKRLHSSVLPTEKWDFLLTRGFTPAQKRRMIVSAWLHPPPRINIPLLTSHQTILCSHFQSVYATGAKMACWRRRWRGILGRARGGGVHNLMDDTKKAHLIVEDTEKKTWCWSLKRLHRLSGVTDCFLQGAGGILTFNRLQRYPDSSAVTYLTSVIHGICADPPLQPPLKLKANAGRGLRWRLLTFTPQGWSLLSFCRGRPSPLGISTVEGGATWEVGSWGRGGSRCWFAVYFPTAANWRTDGVRSLHFKDI